MIQLSCGLISRALVESMLYQVCQAGPKSATVDQIVNALGAKGGRLLVAYAVQQPGVHLPRDLRGTSQVSSRDAFFLLSSNQVKQTIRIMSAVRWKAGICQDKPMYLSQSELQSPLTLHPLVQAAESSIVPFYRSCPIPSLWKLG